MGVSVGLIPTPPPQLSRLAFAQFVVGLTQNILRLDTDAL